MLALRNGRPSNKSRYKWWLVGMLWCVCFLNYADRQAVFSLFPLLQTTLHLSRVQLGLLGSSFMWLYALFGPLAGWLGDRWPRRLLILGGLLLWIVLVFATSLARSFPALVFLRGISGLSEAFYFPAAMALISVFHGPRTRSRAMSLHQSAVYAGTVGGGSLAAIIGVCLGWPASFVFFGCIGVLVALVLLVFLKDQPPGHAEPAEGQDVEPASVQAGLFATARELLSDQRVVCIAFAFIGANFVAMVFLSWLPSFLHDRFHMGLAMAGVGATVFLQIAALCGNLLGGLLGDGWAARDCGGRMLAQSVGLVCGAPFLLLSGQTGSAAVLFSAMIGFGLCKGLYDSNIFASLYDVVPSEQRAAAAGLLNSIGWLGGGLAPISVAYGSVHLGMGNCLSLTSVIYLAAAVLLLLGSRRLQREAVSIAP